MGTASLESGALEKALQREAEGVRSAAGARLLLAVAALASFVPALPGWWIARGYHAIPRLQAAATVRIRETAPGAPPLVGAEAVAAAPDGTLFVADHALRHVVALKAGAPGRWLPPAGRFLPRVGADGRLHLLDVDSGILVRFSPDGTLEARAAVAPPGSSPLFCLAPDGRVLVAAAGAIRRFSADLSGVDASWGPAPHAVPCADVAGLAASAERVWAASRAGQLLVFSAAGALVASAPLVGNAGALEAARGGRLVMADRPTGRLFLLDGNGRTLGRIVSFDGTAPVASPAGLALAPDGRLAVAERASVALLRLPEAVR